MACLSECRFLNRALTIDDISKKPHCKNLKFKRAFQFLQLLLLQRVYCIDVISSAGFRRPVKSSQQQREEEDQNYQVFLGGSCNPTTWRHDQAIPYFLSRSVSFYNPQVPEWTPELVEIEHRAKELAPLLFFVIDYDTRALASIIEVSYLAARGRSIIVVMTPMPERKYTKFIQEKNSANEKDDEDDYENAYEDRRTLRTLLRSLNIPFFDNVQLALECAAFILESTKRTVINQSAFNANNQEDDNERDSLSPLPLSPGEYNDKPSSSVVVIRSLSNKTSFDSPNEFYQQMQRSEMATSMSPFRRQHSSTPEPNMMQFQSTATCTKSQISCSTNESDDDGYGSLSSSNRTLSSSSLSVSSELFEATNDQQREDHVAGSDRTLSNSMINNLVSTFYSYIPFVGAAPPSKSSDSSVTQSLFVLFTLPFRFIQQTLLSPTSSRPSITSFSTFAQTTPSSPSSCHASFSPPPHMFDLYIASGTSDECWLNTFALPTLEQINVTFIKRQSCHENDQTDALDDLHIRKQSRVLFYLINGRERLSPLTSELAFHIGKRQHKIVVYLQLNIDDDADQICSATERRDIQRSRKYLEDLARKENIILCHSREQSWEHVLAFFKT